MLPQAIFAAASLPACGPQIGNPDEVYEKQDRITMPGQMPGLLFKAKAKVFTAVCIRGRRGYRPVRGHQRWPRIRPAGV